MGKTSHPFSGFPSGKDKEDAPRRARQGRFFKQEPEGNRFKFEKIPELPKDGDITIFNPPTERQVSSDFIVEVISDSALILEYECFRVRWYLTEFERYKNLGYDSIIRFPRDLTQVSGIRISDDELRLIVKKELDEQWSDYVEYAEALKKTWNGMAETMIKTATRVYGYSLHGHYALVPTAYGTGGGSLLKGGPVYMKLPKFRPKNRRTETEAITHEILCHEVTATLREGTGIGDSIFEKYQWHKERLMDLLGRTLLVHSGFMKRDDVVMDDYADVQASNDVDPLYYAIPEIQDENCLRYAGRFRDLIRSLDAKLKDGQ